MSTEEMDMTASQKPDTDWVSIGMILLAVVLGGALVAAAFMMVPTGPDIHFHSSGMSPLYTGVVS